MVNQSDFPVFAEHMQEVMMRAASEETSLRQITNIILKDLSLTLKVLRTANTAFYNRSGKSILTVTHAAALLGMEAIRDLAGSMILFQHFRNKSGGLKKLMLLSLVTASHARVTAKRVRYQKLEEAYLCAMFRNLGEVLVACYLPLEYAAILARIGDRGSGERDACLQVLHCTFEDLGEGVTKHWNMPQKVADCMRSEHLRLSKAARTDTDTLEALTAFSHGLTAAIHRYDPKGARARLDHLLETYGPILNIRREDIQEIATAAIEETKSTFHQLKVPLDDLKLHRQMETVMAALEEETEEPVPAPDVPEMPPGEVLLEGLAHEVESLLDSESKFELTNAILMILEALYRGVPFDRVLFGLVAPDHTQVAGKLGLGDGIDELVDKFQFSLSDRSTPVSIALVERQDLFASDGRFEDSELVRLTGAACFGLYPVVVDRVVVGCLYFDRKSPVEPLKRSVGRLVSRLRSLMAEAIETSRGGANS